MRYKAVVCDLDGTLVHTRQEYRFITIRQAFHALGRPDLARDYALMDSIWFEHTRDDILRDRGVDPEHFYGKYHLIETPHTRKGFMNVYPDVRVIGDLASEGYKTGIVTSAPERIMDVEMGLLHGSGVVFDSVVNVNHHGKLKPKPDPEGLNRCMFNLGVRNSDACYVGNGPEDLEAAERAGVRPIIINRREYNFNGFGPPTLITSLGELRELV